MRNISGEAEHAFSAERGFGIAQYAYYEEALCTLYAHLLGVTPAVAGITFFRINNARARVDILEKLLSHAHGLKYRRFWASMKSGLRRLDETRNRVVHWTTIVTHAETPVVSLNPPNHWDANENTPSMLIEDLAAFADECQFFCNTLAYFTYHLEGKSFVTAAWAEVFEQSVQYPPPENHPLRQNVRTR